MAVKKMTKFRIHNSPKLSDLSFKQKILTVLSQSSDSASLRQFCLDFQTKLNEPGWHLIAGKGDFATHIRYRHKNGCLVLSNPVSKVRLILFRAAASTTPTKPTILNSNEKPVKKIALSVYESDLNQNTQDEVFAYLKILFATNPAPETDQLSQQLKAYLSAQYGSSTWHVIVSASRELCVLPFEHNPESFCDVLVNKKYRVAFFQHEGIHLDAQYDLLNFGNKLFTFGGFAFFFLYLLQKNRCPIDCLENYNPTAVDVIFQKTKTNSGNCTATDVAAAHHCDWWLYLWFIGLIAFFALSILTRMYRKVVATRLKKKL